MVTTRRTWGALTLLVGAFLLALLAAVPIRAASVSPIVVTETANQTCQELADQYAPGETWIELKFDATPSGTHPVSDGILSVTITNGTNDSFDWSSNIGVDAVFVKGGSGGSHLYIYDPPPPEATGDTGLVIPNAANNDISHISFCYDIELQITKTATPSFARAWDWTIDKTSDTTELTLSPGQSIMVDYEVTIDATSADSNFAVSGNISIFNPHPSAAATVATVTDVITPGAIAAPVSCPGGLPQALAAGATLVCTYTSPLPDNADRTNTATVTTTGPIDGGSGTAAIDFDGVAPTTETDECALVVDDAGTPGISDDVTLNGGVEYCASSGLPKTFTYQLQVGPYDDPEECGENTFTNTATLTENDTDREVWDDHDIVVTVPCEEGCTLTQGYWKTHSQFGPAPFDDAWFTIGDVDGDGTSEGAAERFFSSGKTWYQILWTPPSGGNAYLQLAHQYIAAKLNIVNGADTTAAVSAAITGAEAFFPGKTPSTSLNNATKNQVKGWATTLDRFNNGLIGPGHCDE